jgi:hypothetical protein
MKRKMEMWPLKGSLLKGIVIGKDNSLMDDWW